MQNLVDKDATMQVLGCILQSPSLLDDSGKTALKVKDFYNLFTRGIFAAMYNLYNAGAKEITIIDIDKYLSKTENIYKEFNKNNGIQYLQDAIEIAQLGNFQYYYNRLKKFSALRELSSKGFDIKDVYDTSLLGSANFKQMEVKFDEMSLNDIFKTIQKNFTLIENDYVSGTSNDSIEACNSISDLKNDFKKRPEVGKNLDGDIYNTVVRGARKGKFYINSGATGAGKALINSLLIPTTKGYKAVGNIKEGDYLFDRKGKPTKVLKTFPQGEKEVFEVIFEDGRRTYCNDEHLWSYWVNGKLETKTLKEIMDYGLVSEKGEYNFEVPVCNSIGIGKTYAREYLKIEKIKPKMDFVTKSPFEKKLLRNFFFSRGYKVFVKKFGENYAIKAEVIKKNRGLPIIAINKTNCKEEMTCFLVDNEEHLFVINDYIVTHNTRVMVGNACNLAYPYKFNPSTGEWEKTGANEKVLFITTELSEDEIQTMILSYLSGINEEKILYGNYDIGEENIVDMSIKIMEKYNNFYIKQLSDPTVGEIVSHIRKANMTKNVNYVFYDYIFSSPGLLNEYRDLKVREDVSLNLLSTALKDIAVELNIFIMSATQLSGDFGAFKGVRDQSFLRGSKSIADKIDVGSITVPVSTQELNMLSPTINKLNLPIPTHVMDVYKVRRGRYNKVKIWRRIDLGTCRVRDCFITDGNFNPIEDFNITKFLEVGIDDEKDEFLQNVKKQEIEPKPELEVEEKETMESDSWKDLLNVY